MRRPALRPDLIAVCSCRGDPTNVDVAAATEAGVPVLRAPGRNANAVAEVAIALLFASTRGVVAADADVRQATSTRTAPSPTSASGRGNWPGGRPAWSDWERSDGP